MLPLIVWNELVSFLALEHNSQQQRNSEMPCDDILVVTLEYICYTFSYMRIYVSVSKHEMYNREGTSRFLRRRILLATFSRDGAPGKACYPLNARYPTRSPRLLISNAMYTRDIYIYVYVYVYVYVYIYVYAIRYNRGSGERKDREENKIHRCSQLLE